MGSSVVDRTTEAEIESEIVGGRVRCVYDTGVVLSTSGGRPSPRERLLIKSET